MATGRLSERGVKGFKEIRITNRTNPKPRDDEVLQNDDGGPEPIIGMRHSGVTPFGV